MFLKKKMLSKDKLLELEFGSDWYFTYLCKEILCEKKKIANKYDKYKLIVYPQNYINGIPIYYHTFYGVRVGSQTFYIQNNHKYYNKNCFTNLQKNKDL